MSLNAEKILAKGLAAGYAGNDAPHTVRRGSFVGEESAMTFGGSDAEYNDQWFFKRIGGGQDIAKTGDEMATRVFAGGIVKPEILKSLGITEQDILSYHKSTLSEVAEKTRLHERITPDADGDWQYRYEVMKDYPDLPLTIGVETITYKGVEVFVHVFLNSPIL